MYLRPRMIFEKLVVAEKVSRIDDRRRQVVEFKPTGDVIFAVVSSAEPKEIERWKSLSHEVTHEVLQHRGRIKANVGDMLIKADKKFLVQAVDNPAGLGEWTIYYCQERFDI